MEKSLFEQMGGTYTQGGDYLIPNLILPKVEDKPIGIWGQRHLQYIKQHKRIFYTNLITSCKLNSYLAEVDERAEEMYLRLVKEMAQEQSVTEQLKAEQPMEWIGRMGNIQSCAREVVNSEVIFV